MDVNLGRLVARSCEQLAIQEDVRERIVAFLQQRLHVQIREKGYGHELSTLAVSVAGSRPLQVLRFLEVFSKLQAEQWFVELVTSAVRVRNILAKSGDASAAVDESLFAKEAESRLYAEIVRINPLVEEALAGQDWKALAGYLSELSPFVTSFFEDVLVMDPDERVKCNRIHLLGLCNALFLKVGDLGILKGV
jgi:glycyl-tRNA synthetase beta chain